MNPSLPKSASPIEPTLSDSPSADSVHGLIEEGQGLVRSIALGVHRSLPLPMDLDDLIAYGQLGLAEAARAYDCDSTTRFTTFAYYRIRGAIYDGVSKMSWTSRARLRRMRFQHIAGDVLAEGVSPQVTDDVERAAVNDADWLGQVTERLAVVYLATGSDDTVSQSMSEAVDQGHTPSRVVADRETQANLRRLVSEMPPDARRLIHAIYFDGFTLTEAAQRAGISKSWASRLHAKSLDQLAKTLRSDQRT